ncbi:hypothetical protein KKD81_00230 [Patescibacteria group bacterium]|nr:hypothetical protein [Patescibacteria group bacterium]
MANYLGGFPAADTEGPGESSPEEDISDDGIDSIMRWHSDDGYDPEIYL